MSKLPPQIPPAVSLAGRLLREIEIAVSRWPRNHRYSHGMVLRQQAMETAQLAHWAWRDRDERGASIEALVRKVDDVKISLQLGSEIKAFASFEQFEAIIRVAEDLGRQVGGWRKHLKGQNETPPASSAQRAQILSPRAASAFEAQR